MAYFDVPIPHDKWGSYLFMHFNPWGNICSVFSSKLTSELGWKSEDELLQKKYGISIAQFEAMWEKQKGLCAICGRRLTKGDKGYAIDHDHNTGRVRGLLCPVCNKLLGMAYEDITILEKAIVYLKVEQK